MQPPGAPPNELTPLIASAKGPAPPSPRSPALSPSSRLPSDPQLLSPSYAADSPSSSSFSPFRAPGFHSLMGVTSPTSSSGGIPSPSRGNLAALLSDGEDGEDDDNVASDRSAASSPANSDRSVASSASDEQEPSQRAYFASPAKILCSACMKGDFFQAQSAIEMAVAHAAAAAQSLQAASDEGEAEPTRSRKRKAPTSPHEADALMEDRVAASVFRLLTTLESRHQMNALHLAALYDHPTLVEYLVNVGEKYLPRVEASSINHRHASPPNFEAFIDSPCGAAKHSATPLMLCSSVACARVLLDAGARLHETNSSGMTALHYAASTGNAAFVSLLLYRGADVNQTDARGATALHWAVFEGFQYTAMLLVGYGADQKIRDSEQQTALMIASALGDSFLSKQLVLEGAPVKARDKHGRTALDIARQGGHVDTARALSAGVSDRLVTWASRKGVTVAFFWVMVVGCEALSLIFAIPAVASFLDRPTGQLSVITIVMCVSTCALYTYVCTKDPGYVAKSNEPAFMLLAEEDVAVPCPTCVTRKPLRSKHCSACRRCVNRFDHHCPWINNCVGRGNHQSFLYFLTSLAIFCWCVGAASVLVIAGRAPLLPPVKSPSDMLAFGPPAWSSVAAIVDTSRTTIILLHAIHIALVVCAVVFGGPTTALLVIQLRNVRRNLTTNEVFNKDKYPYLKMASGEFYNPFDDGCATNFADACGCVSVDYDAVAGDILFREDDDDVDLVVDPQDERRDANDEEVELITTARG